jgi:hypothetical protein
VTGDSPEDLVEWLRKQRWSDYARKVLAHYQQHGSLTDKQIETVVRMKNRTQEDF